MAKPQPHRDIWYAGVAGSCVRHFFRGNFADTIQIAAAVPGHVTVVSQFAGFPARLLSPFRIFCRFFTLVRCYFAIQKSGRQAIRVVRVVVVAAAGAVDIPEIRGVRDIRRARPPIAGENSRKQPVCYAVLLLSLF